MLRGLRGLQLIGGDVCEVSPPLDPTGQVVYPTAADNYFALKTE
jgi:arginase family enzyme